MIMATASIPESQRQRVPIELLSELFTRGLGELIVMHASATQVLLGELVMEKGRLVLKDRGLMKDIQPRQVAACTETGVLGGLCHMPGCEWDSLTFLGTVRCAVPVDLISTRTGLLAATRNQYGESLIDFKGSVYRAFQVMLDNHFLPVPLLRRIETKLGPPALAVCDLRMASIPLSIVSTVHDLVRSSLAKHMTLDVADVDLENDEFSELFRTYLKGN